MNIDDLTFGDIKKIQALFGGDKTHEKESEIDQLFIGKQVIARCAQSGVHFGTLVKKEGSKIVLQYGIKSSNACEQMDL